MHIRVIFFLVHPAEAYFSFLLCEINRICISNKGSIFSPQSKALRSQVVGAQAKVILGVFDKLKLMISSLISKCFKPEVRFSRMNLTFDVEPELVIVKKVEEACEYSHIGRPTIQINGLDIEPDARNLEQFGMA